MKKILLSTSLLVSLLSLRGMAQSFTLQHDTARQSYANAQIELFNNINNVSSSAITVRWKVIAANSDFPQSWLDSVGICDNNNCYNNGTTNELLGPNGQKTTSSIPAGTSCPFDLTMGMSNLPNGNHFLTVQMSQGSTQKYSVFNVSKSSTGVVNVSRTDNDVLLYPSPAHNELNVNFNGALGVRNVMLYNLIGKVVATRKVNDDNVQMDLSNMPSGVYFVRLTDGNGNVVATRRFTHQ